MKNAKVFGKTISNMMTEIRRYLPNHDVDYLDYQWKKKPLPLVLFLLMCLNLVIAPTVYAATDGNINRINVYALGILGLVTLGLAIYLFVVIFQPERF
ncbi:MAG TPA: K(+)-transporting ATPase subunit F [Leptolyngbyaceae cyanobacterium]